MSLKYLNNKSWSQVTREERYFCSHLYHFLINKEKSFVKWLNQKPEANFPVNNNWEIAFETCFYRDFHYHHETILPVHLRKRTFDLCLFSDNHIIIIEAKVQQGFKSEQLNSFVADTKEINKLPKMHKVKISKVLLYSSKYNFDKNKFNLKEKNPNFYEITWEDLYNEYKNPVFIVADEKYKKEKSQKV